MLTFLRWVYLYLAGIGNHVLLDEEAVEERYRQLMALATMRESSQAGIIVVG